MRKIAYLVLRVINRIVPKRHNQILFASIPDFSDNAKALFEYMANNKVISSKYHLLWTIGKKEMIEKLQQAGIKAYVQKSIMGLCQFFRSKYIIVTHNQYGGFKTDNQFLINLWHGMPLKAMGFVDNLEDKKNLLDLKRGTKVIDILIATSTITKSALIACFLIDPKKVYITGQPRNDKLFSSKSKLNLMKLLQIDISKYNNVILFAPTFRKWGDRTEGMLRDKNIFNFPDYDNDELCNFLKINKALLLVKLHPIEESLYLSKFKEQFKQEYNVIFISTRMLQENLVDLYDILGAIDILITDYSSIYFDFLLLNRPIIFISTDLEEYSMSRGLILEPYDFWTPGPKTTTFQDFIRELNNFLINPRYYEEKRIIVNNIINKYQDDKSCERVWEIIKQLGD